MTRYLLDTSALLTLRDNEAGADRVAEVLRLAGAGSAKCFGCFILDRLMHRCAMLEFEGKSYRLKEAAARIAITPCRHNPGVLPGGIWGGHGWGKLNWPSGIIRRQQSGPPQTLEGMPALVPGP